MLLPPGGHNLTKKGYIYCDFTEFANQFPIKLSDRLDRALLNLSKLSNFLGHEIRFTEYEYALLFAEHRMPEEFTYLRKSLIQIGYLEGQASIPGVNKLTTKGWERVYELETQRNPNTKKVFVAMSYDSSYEYVWKEGIELGVKAAGFDPFLIKDVDYNHEITDRMIAEIRECRFMVADFTGQNRGVYFEAGYALGLNKQVIMTCRDEEISKCHFDTNHRNHINWKNTDELKQRLADRIRATIV